MANNNFISINGKKIELTDEQVKQIKEAGYIKDNPFERVKKGGVYFYINAFGQVDTVKETCYYTDNKFYSIANYCTDRKLMEHRALHETLSRLLWRFSMTNGGDEIDWSKITNKWHIYYDYNSKYFYTGVNQCQRKPTEIYFKDNETAEQAIEEIIKPFVKEHPEFVW